jgi:hypothetical protein
VQVFQNQDDRRVVAEHVERFDQLSQHPLARRPLGAPLHGVQLLVGQQRRQLHEPGRRVLREDLHQPFAPGLAAPSRQGLEHRKVGFAGAVLLHALAARDTRSVPDRDLRQERLDQSGLADPWLAGDEHELALAIDRARQPGMEPCELGHTPHQKRGQQ